MDEDTADSEELRSLAEEAVETFKNVISLNFRVSGHHQRNRDAVVVVVV